MEWAYSRADALSVAAGPKQYMKPFLTDMPFEGLQGSLVVWLQYARPAVRLGSKRVV